MCIFTVKSIAKCYTRQNNPVFKSFLDASKAFDCINHWTLFRKFIDYQGGSSAFFCVLEFLFFWYQMQLVCIKWGTAVSQYFCISNGVRQGVILSPKLFALYMNRLSGALSHCKTGCYINEQCMNHILYTDDICVMAPRAIALQKLVDVCFEYSIANDLLFNPVKSVGIVFTPCRFKLYCPTVFIGTESPTYVNTL